ncbi:hypothetical protein BXO88_14550 [Oribacterium sp. C9]|uniref:protein kinase domain-containing protein n=1 Tax=Oribacterium sp. C9 TaxID=1943579 RepID=UPI00098FED02|nr:hypothetical protein [Oribacterium sp. C9]OON85004.1 hypothetical protein BXO88_14550 [Oribacterium sp. C9]
MNIKRIVTYLPLSDNSKEHLSQVYHAIHDPTLKLYLSVISLVRIINWNRNQKKGDLDAITKFKDVDDIIPIHVSSWHHGRAYFKVRVGKEIYFMKKEINDDIAEREVAFFNIVNSSEDSIIDYFPKLVYYIKDNNYTYIISSYIQADSSNMDIIKTLKPEEKSILLEQLMVLMRWLRLKGLCHNDLRLDNIFITRKSVKLFDFGYSCLFDEKEKFLDSLSYEELEKLNKHNRIGKFISDDAFSMYNIMKEIQPEFMSTDVEIWQEINAYMGERVIQKIL